MALPPLGELLKDCTLPEHPDALRERLRALGEWTDAQEIFVKARRERYHHFHKLRKQRGEPASHLTLPEKVESNLAAYSKVFSIWPPPPGAAPLASLAKHLESETIVKKRHNLQMLTPETLQRFEAIGEAEDHAADILWVYQNISNNEPDQTTCPSRGAWELLKEGRRKKGWFYEKMYRPVAQQLSKAQSAKNDDVYKPSKAEKLAVADLDAMITESVEASQQ